MKCAYEKNLKYDPQWATLISKKKIMKIQARFFILYSRISQCMIHLPGSKCDGEFLNTLSDVEDKPVMIRNLSVPGLDVIPDGIGQNLKK